MAKISLQERLSSGVLFLDGAMGTQLFERGAQFGECVELLNADRPEIVADVHKAYLDAGCDAVLTNTFGGSGVGLKRHGQGARTAELNRLGAELARFAAGSERYVIGDIGPCGEFLEPLGTLSSKELFGAFAEQAGGLAEGGVDGFIIETMTAIEEIELAIDAVRSISKLPIMVSLAYDAVGDGFRTMMGITPEQAVGRFSKMDIAAVGFNCGTLDLNGYIRLAQEHAGLLQGSRTLLLAEPNAGKPELVEGRAVYRVSPEEYARALRQIYDAGVQILGGCCGTSPDHLAAAVKKIKK